MGTTLYQYLAVMCANLSTFTYAIAIGWMGNVFILYDSPLPSGRVQLNELAWIGSILGIGGLIGTMIIGWLADKFGRKQSLIAMAIPLIEAVKSLRFYRNVQSNVPESKCFELELIKLKSSYVEMHKKSNDNESSACFSLRDFKNRPFAICCALMVAHEICGVFTMIRYAGMIFAKSGSTLSPGISSIFVGGIQVVGSYFSTVFVDRLGRKLLMVVSFAGAGLCHAILATYIFLSTATNVNVDSFNWVPVVSFSGMILIAGCGAMPVPYVVIGEILPNKIRNIGITFCMCLSWGATFLLVKVFPALLPLINIYGCIYLSAISCFATVIYLIMAVSETKGKSLDEILLILKVRS